MHFLIIYKEVLEYFDREIISLKDIFTLIFQI